MITRAQTKMTTKRKPATKSKSTVNKAGNYTKPGMRKKIFNRIKAQKQAVDIKANDKKRFLWKTG